MVNPAGDRPETLPAKVVAALDRLARGRRTHRQAMASRHGLTPLQVDLLATLADGPPPPPMVGFLATELGVTQPTVTDSLRALEAKGLIERGSDAADRRRTTVVLTRRGHRTLRDFTLADRQLTDAVGALDPASQATTLETVLTLIAHLVANGTIDVARTCLTCRFHEQDDDTGHRCALLDVDLPPTELRVNCREHEPSPA